MSDFNNVPRNGNTAEVSPINHASPGLVHPDKLKKVPNTKCGLFGVARIVNGIKMPKKARMWTTRTNVSMRGKSRIATVFTKPQSSRTAQKMRVPCHLVGE